jgi:hypothetical protein
MCLCVSVRVLVCRQRASAALFLGKNTFSISVFHSVFLLHSAFFCLKKIHISTWCDLVEHPQVDKTVVSTFKLKDLASHLLGPEGTQVELVMLRKGSR